MGLMCNHRRAELPRNPIHRRPMTTAQTGCSNFAQSHIPEGIDQADCAAITIDATGTIQSSLHSKCCEVRNMCAKLKKLITRRISPQANATTNHNQKVVRSKNSAAKVSQNNSAPPIRLWCFLRVAAASVLATRGKPCQGQETIFPAFKSSRDESWAVICIGEA